MVLTQFQELVTTHYAILKDLLEFKEAHDIYLELYEVRKRLSEIEIERQQYYSELGQALKQDDTRKFKL